MKPSPWILTSTLPTLLLLAGCGEPQEPFGVDHVQHTQAPSAAVSEAPGAPTEVPLFVQFEDLNPCTGQPHTVTVTGTMWIHELDGRVVIRTRRTITTSSGFEGSGTHTIVRNGNVVKFTLNDMLTHPSGDRIRAHLVLVVDLTTSPPTVRVRQGTWDGTVCVGQTR